MNWLHEPKMSEDNFLSKFSPKKKRKYKKMMLTSPKFLCLSLNITLPNYSRSSTKLTPCAPGHTTVFQYSSQNVLPRIGFRSQDVVSAGLSSMRVCVCVCVCEVAQLCLTLCNPVDCSPPGSSVHGILQARILEWVAMAP